ncbi:MAG: class I SAM-dependent methyltransferase [Candidatus Omnitrophica bacterium]|nr:class I SAM-dependent methyltransferase [Candidatus Omnitrophota bacterium]
MFKERQIRSAKKGKLIDKVRLDDIRKFFLDGRGSINRRYFIRSACPACAKTGNPKAFLKDKFTFLRCQRCNTLYVSPRPRPDKLLQYYQHSQWNKLFTRDILEKTAAVRKEVILKPRAKSVISYIKTLGISRNLLAEIGGGNGAFLEVIKRERVGFKRYLNIEPSTEGARLTKRRGFDVINSFIEQIKELGADCICAFELIEHVFDPFVFCRKLNGLLNKNGILIMTTPNIEGLDLLLLGRDSANIIGPNHLNYFNQKSIARLMQRTGFKIISLETPGVLDTDILKNRVTEGYRLKDGFISSLLTKPEQVLENFQRFLQQNRMSSNMLIVARKR